MKFDPLRVAPGIVAPGPLRWLTPEAAPYWNCWRVFSIQVSDVERVEEDKDDVEYPDQWLWGGWSPEADPRLAGAVLPTTFGLSVGNPYDTLAEEIGSQPMVLLQPEDLDLVGLIDLMLDLNPLTPRLRVHLQTLRRRARRQAAARAWQRYRGSHSLLLGAEARSFYQRWMPGLPLPPAT